MAEVAAPRPAEGGFLDDYFEISARGSNLGTEVVAGITTFMVAAYIIFVNPSILSAAGLPFGPLLTLTALTAGILTLAMGIFAKYPFMIAPGMGLNAVVAFQLVQGMGLSPAAAMGVIFIEGVIIAVLVLTGFREAVMDAIPMRLKQSIGVGIGLFIAIIGLVNGGIVVMSGNPSAPIALGNLATGTFLVTLFGLVVTTGLEARKVKGSLLIGILVTTIFAILLNTAYGGVLYEVPGMAVVPAAIFGAPDFSLLGLGLNVAVFAQVGALAAVLAIFSIMLADFFDTMGTVIGIGEQAGWLDEKGEFPPGHLRKLLFIDSLGAALGGAAGSSSNTTFIESAAGVSEGGRTGFASVVTGVLFLAAMFLTPIAGVIPPQATAAALVIIGYLMFAGNIRGIVQDLGQMDRGDAFVEGMPAMLTLFIMPATYSITNGIGAGFVAYTVLKAIQGKAREVHWMMWLASVAFAIYFIWGLT